MARVRCRGSDNNVSLSLFDDLEHLKVCEDVRAEPTYMLPLHEDVGLPRMVDAPVRDFGTGPRCHCGTRASCHVTEIFSQLQKPQERAGQFFFVGVFRYGQPYEKLINQVDQGTNIELLAIGVTNILIEAVGLWTVSGDATKRVGLRSAAPVWPRMQVQLNTTIVKTAWRNEDGWARIASVTKSSRRPI